MKDHYKPITRLEEEALRYHDQTNRRYILTEEGVLDIDRGTVDKTDKISTDERFEERVILDFIDDIKVI